MQAALLAIIGFVGIRAPADPLANDVRLAARRTLRAHDRSVRDLLADLTLQTGIRFFVNPSIAEDRVNVFLHDRPLKESLQAVSGFMRLEWEREGMGADTGYLLKPSAAAVAEEAKQRKDSAAELADRISEQAALYGKLEALPESELLNRENAIGAELITLVSAERRRELQLEQAICLELRSGNVWRRLINRFIRTLPRTELTEVIRDGQAEYAWPPTQGVRLAPQSLFEDAKLGALFGSPGQLDYVRIRLTTDFIPAPSLRWVLTVGRKAGGAYASPEFAGSLPSTMTSITESPPEEPKGWRDDPALAAPVTLHIDANITSPGKGRNRQLVGRHTLGEILSDMNNVKPVDMIADALAGSRVAGIYADSMPVGEVLNRLSQMTSHRWWKEDGIVYLRSLSYDAEHRRDPPALALERWTERARAGSLDLDDLGEMSALPDAQLGTFLMMSLRGEFPEQMDSISRARDHLRLWNSLTSAQKRLARGPGVKLADLAENVQPLFMKAAQDPRAETRFSSLPAPGKKAKFRIDVRQGRLWGVRLSGIINLSGVATREDAFAQFQRVNPAIKVSDVKSVLYTTVFFLYEDNEKLLTRSLLTLPARWDDRDPNEN